VVNQAPVYILLIAEDDEDDCLLARQALKRVPRPIDARFVADGEELIAYLRRQGRYEDPASSPEPHLILLDLNMPNIDGLEALSTMKGDPSLCAIPVVAFSTSTAPRDVEDSHTLGVNDFASKPATFDELVDFMRTVTDYWFDRALPPPAVGSGKTR